MKKYKKYKMDTDTIFNIFIIIVFVSLSVFFGIREMHYNCVGHFDYTVKEGDTISSILNHYYGDDENMNEIFKDSYGFPTVGDRIYEGQIISLPLYKWSEINTK